MLSNTLISEGVDFSVRTSSTSKLNNLEQSPSVGRSEKKRITQTTSDSSMFMSIFETFENALSQLQIDSVHEKTLEKLIKIEESIKRKILLINRYKSVKQKNKRFFKEYSLSMENLSSKASEKNIQAELFSAEFLKRVNCPFCSMPKTDKIELIEHLDEDCKPRIYKMFDKKQYLAKSAVQILPNNTFKCNICPSVFLSNLLNYFKHLQNTLHISAYNKTAEAKNYTEFLFCSCCKVQVANNYTQIHFHMNHSVHEARRASALNSAYFLKKGIHFVYLESRKFKCLDCPFNFYKSPGEILRHFENENHMKRVKKNVPDLSLLFCEVCSNEVPIFEIFGHLSSSDHKDKENKIVKTNYEFCFFCDFVCSNLMDLSLHMESKCSAINSIREKNPKLKKKSKNDLKEDKTADECDIDGGYVIVKGYKKVPMLYSYFEQFGEIALLELCYDKNIKIKFKEKSIAAHILLLRDKLSIDGVKLEVTTDDKMLNCKERTNIYEERQVSIEKENFLSSCDSSESEEDSYSIENSDATYNRMPPSDQLENMFQKVTSHLMNISQKLDSTEEVKSILNVLEICIGRTCNLVGFAGCGLSFPAESISIYFAMGTDSYNIFPKENISVNENNVATEEYLRNLSRKMIESELWQNVINSVGSFPHIQCQHKETQKTCTITCAKSATFLTEMLRDCLKDNYLVRSFCLLLRFWLTAHKLKIRQFEYVVMSLLIFFLISEKVVNLSHEKYYKKEDFSLEEKIRDMLDLNGNSPSEENKEAFDLKELFHKFLQFLSKYDFDKLAIYLPLPYPIPKRFVLKKLAKSSNYDKIPKSFMYITESDYLQNLASCVSEKHVNSLLEIVNSAIKSYGI